MNRLKLFEEYSQNKFQEAEDFLDDAYAEFLDKWGFIYVPINDIGSTLNNTYSYNQLPAIWTFNFLLFSPTGSFTGEQLKELESEFKDIFNKKIKPIYRFSRAQGVVEFTGLNRLMIELWNINRPGVE